MSLTAGISHLRAGNEAISKLSESITRPDGANIRDSSIEDQGYGRYSVSIRREMDIYKFQNVLTATSEANYTNAIFEVNSTLNDLLGDADSQNSIAARLEDLTNAFGDTSDALSVRSNVVQAATNFTTVVGQYYTGLTATKIELENKISSSINGINDAIKNLVSINGAIGGGGSVVTRDSQDQRDQLLVNLSELMGIRYNLGDNGQVTVLGKNSSSVVDGNSFVQFSYTQDLDLLNPNPASQSLILNYYNLGDNPAVHSPRYNTSIPISRIINGFGGELAGLFNARDNVLPVALSNINTAIGQITSRINELHNVGSGYPPMTSFQSTRTMLSSDIANFKGKVNFGVTDVQGNMALDLQGNPVRPVTIDFDKLSTTNPAGQVSVSDIINEINQVAAAPSKASVGLGSVGVPVGQPPQFLVNQVRLVPTTNISANGTMAFRLDVSSGSRFSTQFQVTGMAVYDAAGNALANNNLLPQNVVNIDAGSYTKTGQDIVVNLNPAEQFNTVRLKMLVAGENGVFEESWADFVVGVPAGQTLANAAIINQRSEAIQSANDAGIANVSPARPNLAGGNAAAVTAARIGGPLVNALLVDANGLRVNDAGAAGYLQINSGTGGGVVIDSSNSAVKSLNAGKTSVPENFAHWFDLNDLFVVDEKNPSVGLSVSSNVTSNASNVSLGKAQEVTHNQTVRVGETLPSATLDLSGGNPGNGDIINIGGQAITFSNVVPVPAGQVGIGANSAATIQSLYNALQSNGAITAQVTINKPGPADTFLKITGLTQNSNVALLSAIGAGNQWKVSAATPGGGLVGHQTITGITGGYASAILDCSGVNTPVNGDTVTVNGVQFQFVNALPAPGVQNPVLIAGGAPAAVSILALKNALNQSNNPRIKGLFTFSIDAAQPAQLIATATNAGAAGNTLTIDSNIAAGGGGNKWIQPKAPLVAGAVNNLIGGVDVETSQQVNTHALAIGPDNTGVFSRITTTAFQFDLTTASSSQTLSNFLMTSFWNKMDEMVNASELQKDIDEGFSEQLQIEYDGLYKLSDSTRESLRLKLYGLISTQKMNMGVVRELIKLQEYLLQTL